mmetsp:Transcript_7347/g.19081  ORF Transcript_7347/g.19081 Transcript_7347/m.19081 type:complete len:217 (-) Transcript_7347:463-1113(-)
MPAASRDGGGNTSSGDSGDTAVAPAPAGQMPCFVKGLEAALSGGVLGYVFGFGSKLVMFRGSGGFRARWAMAGIEAKSSARMFATFGGVYAAALCYSRRLRLKNDPFDGAVAGCSTGLLVGFQGGPMSALQSCLGLGVVSYYLEKMGVGTAPPEAASAAALPPQSAPGGHRAAVPRGAKGLPSGPPQDSGCCGKLHDVPSWVGHSIHLLLKPAFRL